MELLELLAEPGTRQIVVGSSSFIMGVVKTARDVYQMNKYSSPYYRCKDLKERAMGLEITHVSRSKSFAGFRGFLFDVFGWTFPASVGVVSAIENSNCLRDSIGVETVSDIGSAIGGYVAGRIGGFGILYGLGKGLNYLGKNSRKN